MPRAATGATFINSTERGAPDAASWTDGRATVGPQGAQVKQNRQLPETSPLAAELGAVIQAALKKTMYFSAALPLLADPEDYAGGELVVTDTYGAHEVKLPAGDMILYPLSSVLKVEPVTRGARVCLFFWVQSMVRDDNRRSLQLELELELDQTIQRLRMRVGDCEEVVTLTSHYHNLFRMWAEL